MRVWLCKPCNLPRNMDESLRSTIYYHHQTRHVVSVEMNQWPATIIRNKSQSSNGTQEWGTELSIVQDAVSFGLVCLLYARSRNAKWPVLPPDTRHRPPSQILSPAVVRAAGRVGVFLLLPIPINQSWWRIVNKVGRLGGMNRRPPPLTQCSARNETLAFLHHYAGVAGNTLGR